MHFFLYFDKNFHIFLVRISFPDKSKQHPRVYLFHLESIHAIRVAAAHYPPTYPCLSSVATVCRTATCTLRTMAIRNLFRSLPKISQSIQSFIDCYHTRVICSSVHRVCCNRKCKTAPLSDFGSASCGCCASAADVAGLILSSISVSILFDMLCVNHLQVITIEIMMY